MSSLTDSFKIEQGLLMPGESLAPLEAGRTGTTQDDYGFRFGDVINSSNQWGNTAVLVVEEGGAVEPVVITGNVTLRVRAVQGAGRLVVWNIFSYKDDVAVYKLDDSMQDPVKLVKGDAHYYLNVGDGDLVIRDDSVPDFVSGDEQQILVGEGREIQLPVAFLSYFGLVNEGKC